MKCSRLQEQATGCPCAQATQMLGPDAGHPFLVHDPTADIRESPSGTQPDACTSRCCLLPGNRWQMLPAILRASSHPTRPFSLPAAHLLWLQLWGVFGTGSWGWQRVPGWHSPAEPPGHLCSDHSGPKVPGTSPGCPHSPHLFRHLSLGSMPGLLPVPAPCHHPHRSTLQSLTRAWPQAQALTSTPGFSSLSLPNGA